jgi:hypothetical protein
MVLPITPLDDIAQLPTPVDRSFVSLASTAIRLCVNARFLSRAVS